MKRVLFLDSTCPDPYDAETLQTKPQGGTESSVTRVAEGLADLGYEVILAQHNRKKPGAGRVAYIGFDHFDHIQNKPHAVVALRKPDLIPFAHERWKDARKFLWLHDFNQQDVVQAYPQLQGIQTRILCVSQTHKTLTTSALLCQLEDARGLTTDYVYNPIGDCLSPDNTPVQANKLVFFSSPHKGLKQALDIFESVRRFDETFELHLANPGYFKSYTGKRDGVVNHGTLTHSEVIAQVRSALCVLHPNFVFPETFGIVTAEALAVGTPILTTPFGATREVLGTNSKHVIKAPELKPWVDTLLKWKSERPKFEPVNEEFRLSNVLKRWMRLFE